MSKVIVAGLGYVGLVIAVKSAEAGHEVIGLEVDRNKVNSLRNNNTYIEDVTDAQLAAVQGRFTAIHADDLDEITGFDIGIIAVPTPMREKTPDLAYVASAGRLLGRVMQGGEVIVLESTTYPGTTEGLLADAIFETSKLRPEQDYHLGFSPERIDPGNKTYTFENTPKLVSGTNQEALEKIKAFYDTVVETTVPVSSPAVAEITKLYENTFANVNIALVNEMATICHELGIDVWEMIEAGQTKGHSMQAWYPGPGVGGHCLPVDPLYLDWLSKTKLNRPFRFAELADNVNTHMPNHVVERTQDILNDRYMSLKGARILLVGVTYKPGSNDMRESPSLDVIRLLRNKGALVTVTDPHMGEWNETPRIGVEDMHMASDFDLVIVSTAHEEYDYDKLALTAPQVFDTRHVMTPASNVVFL